MRVRLAAGVLFLVGCQQPTSSLISPTPPDSNLLSTYYLFGFSYAVTIPTRIEIYSNQGSEVRSIVGGGNSAGITDWQASTKKFIYQDGGSMHESNLDNSYNATLIAGEVFSPSWTVSAFVGEGASHYQYGTKVLDSSNVVVLRGSDTLANIWNQGMPLCFLDENRIVVYKSLGGNYDHDSVFVVDIRSAMGKQFVGKSSNGSPRLSVSPDRQRLAWVEWRQDTISLYDFVTGQSRRVPWVASSLSWSPDSRRLIVLGGSTGTDNTLSILDATTGSLVKLPLKGNLSDSRQYHVGTGPSSACWSPDGKQIAFGYLDGGVYGIAVANADGSNIAKLTFAGDYRPAWTPDGKNIVYLSEKDGLTSVGGLVNYVMHPDGSNSRPLFTPVFTIFYTQGFSPLY